MKILLVNDFKVGGGAEVVFNLTYEILKSEVDVEMFYCKGKIQRAANVFTYLFSIKYFFVMLFKCFREKYDIIYVLNYSYAFSPSILLAIKLFALFYQVKVIYNAHDFHLICANSGFTYFENGKLRNFQTVPRFRDLIFLCIDARGHIFSTLKKIQWFFAYRVLRLQNVFNLIICPSHFLSEKMALVLQNTTIAVVRNPCDFNVLSHFNHHSNRIEADYYKFVYYGRLSEEKGLQFFIRDLLNYDNDFVFHIYGTGPFLLDLQAVVRDCNLQSKIEFKGFCPWDILMSKLHEYDVFVLPSLWNENAPLSIVEAAYFNLFILTQPYGGMKEMAELFNSYAFISKVDVDYLNKIFSSNILFDNIYSDFSDFTIEKFKSNILKELI